MASQEDSNSRLDPKDEFFRYSKIYAATRVARLYRLYRENKALFLSAYKIPHDITRCQALVICCQIVAPDWDWHLDTEHFDIMYVEVTGMSFKTHTIVSEDQ